MPRLDLYFLIAFGKGLLGLINYCGPPLLLGVGKHLKALFPVLAFGKRGRLLYVYGQIPCKLKYL